MPAWLMPALGRTHVASEPGSWSAMMRCALWCRRSWSWTGVRNRSPPGYGRASRPVGVAVCHESICQALYCGGKGGLSRTLTKRLLTGRPLRKRRRRINQCQIRFIGPAALIDARPPVIELRSRVGDWEDDLIVGRMSKSAIGTLVDRTSRFVRLVHLPAGHAAEAFVDAVVPVLDTLPESARLSLTWDQGSILMRTAKTARYLRTRGEHRMQQSPVAQRGWMMSGAASLSPGLSSLRRG